MREERTASTLRIAAKSSSSPMAVDDPRPVEVVWRDLHADAVTGEDADAEAPHLARDVAEDLVAVVELHSEHRVRERLEDLAFELDLLFLGQTYMTLTFVACGPFGDSPISYSTLAPSTSVRKPSPAIAEKCTNASLPPSSGVMKPKPFSSLNHFTTPVAISTALLIDPACARGTAFPHTTIAAWAGGPDGQVVPAAAAAVSRRRAGSCRRPWCPSAGRPVVASRTGWDRRSCRRCRRPASDRRRPRCPGWATARHPCRWSSRSYPSCRCRWCPAPAPAEWSASGRRCRSDRRSRCPRRP